MYNRYKSVILLFILLMSATLSAQDQMTTLTTTGSGPSKEIAVQQSLRSAIEQAFGAFISAKTEILNDELVSDEITSVSSGNVQEYKLLSEVYNSEASSYFVTTKVTVSISKLTAFVQSKGVEVEVKGGLFAANMIQQELNAKSEYEAIKNMLVPFHEAMWKAYDFSMTTSQPVLLDNESNEWKIDGAIEANANENLDLAYSLIENTLRGISLSPTEVEEYLALGKEVYPVFLIAKDEPKKASEYKIKGYTLGGPENWAKGTMISSIAETYRVSEAQVLSKLPSDYIKVKWGYNILSKKTPSSIFSWGEVPKDFIFLRNPQSCELLKNVAFSMYMVYGQNFDVSSNIHHYSSFFDARIYFSEENYRRVIRWKKIPAGIYSFTRETPFWDATTCPSHNDRLRSKYKGFNNNSIPDEYVRFIENGLTYNETNFLIFQNMGTGVYGSSMYGVHLSNDYYSMQKVRKEMPVIRFMPKRNFLLIDVLTFNDLSRLNRYEIQLSVNEFSYENGCLILNTVR
jgi:hypothetical protein